MTIFKCNLCLKEEKLENLAKIHLSAFKDSPDQGEIIYMEEDVCSRCRSILGSNLEALIRELIYSRRN